MFTDERLDLRNYYTGVIHIHSEYSHDGHNKISDMSAALKADGVDFCVLTDHFEDFDDAKFRRYLTEIKEVNRLQQTVFVPAIEAEFLGFHVIFLPVSGYDQIRTIVDRRHLGDSPLIKILAHPSKHPLSDVLALLRDHKLNGVELWNQQADSSYLPPARCFQELIGALSGNIPSVIFGSDVHNLKHKIHNVILIDRKNSLTEESIVTHLREKTYTNYNRKIGRHLSGNSSRVSIGRWFDEIRGKAENKAFVMQGVKRLLRFFYHLLPRSTQHQINDFKNAVKSRF